MLIVVGIVIKDGWTALMVAIERGHTDILSQLLSANADVNIKGNVSTTIIITIVITIISRLVAITIR